MDPLTLGAIFGGGGLLKSLTLDRAKEDRQRKLAAETQRYSPWTGMQAQAIEEADPLGSTMQFGMTGASLGQGMENQAFQKQLQDRQMSFWEKMANGNGGSMASGMAAGPSRLLNSHPWLGMAGG